MLPRPLNMLAIKVTKDGLEIGEMAQWFSMQAVLAEDQSPVPSKHQVAYNHL